MGYKYKNTTTTKIKVGDWKYPKMLDRLTVGPSSAQEDKNMDTKPLLCRISSSLYSQLGFRLQYSPHTGDHILTNVEHDSPAERVGIRDGHRLLQVNMTRTLGLSSMFPVFIISFNKNVFILLTFVKNQPQKDVGTLLRNSIAEHQSVDVLVANAKTVNMFALGSITINDAASPLYAPPMYK